MKKDNRKFIPIPKDEYFKKITKYQYECPFERTLSCQSVIRKDPSDGHSYFIASIKMRVPINKRDYAAEEHIDLSLEENAEWDNPEAREEEDE